MADVERKWGENYAVVTSDKRKTTFTIAHEKRNNPRYVFTVDKGTIPKELMGRFSTIELAIQAFEDFEKKTNSSATVRRDEWQEERNAKLSSKDG